MKQVYLLTGRPGTGKTSLIKQAIAGVKAKAGGFYTEEIRSGGIRKGFKLVTLDGEEAIMAHIKIQSRYQVGKYGVDVDALDRVGVAALQRSIRHCRLVVVDEIGRMELFSDSFRKTVLEIIDSGKRLLGTIMFNSNRWADAIKRSPEVQVIPVTGANRQQVLAGLQQWLGGLEGEEADG
jgi:nucleoside-triphosphatase